MIEFNKPYYSKTAKGFIEKAFDKASLFRGSYYDACVALFREKYQFDHVIPTSSCTMALELTARLIGIQPGDEVIVPSYTYVSTANAFASFGAHIVLADSRADHPNMDIAALEALISEKTKAIVVMHYGGYPCDLVKLKELINGRNIAIVEDAAHCIGCRWENEYPGKLSDFLTFSFHETKNISCGQGGLLVINNEKYLERAFVLKENGTNRDKYLKGLTDKYVWLDVGSTFNLPELSCCMLYANLLEEEEITQKRRELWINYYNKLLNSTPIILPPRYLFEKENGHIFYVLARSAAERQSLAKFLLEEKKIKTASHYIGLHLSPYYKSRYGEFSYPNSERYTQCLFRLPMHYELTAGEQDHVVNAIFEFYENAGASF